MKTAPKNSKSSHFITGTVRGVRDERARDSSQETFCPTNASVISATPNLVDGENNQIILLIKCRLCWCLGLVRRSGIFANE